MENFIERYVYDVTRRLPEKERKDVESELKSNIYDMLPEQAGEEETKDVLRRLGPPALLAEGYRQNPRYLISPAVYVSYIDVLKLVLPIVATVLLVVGGIMGGLNAGKAADLSTPAVITAVISGGISMSVSGAFQALVWITVGYAIAERAGAAKKYKDAWKPEDLPQVPVNEKGTIPLSDSIAGLVITAIFSILAVLVFTGSLPLVFSLTGSGTTVVQFFSQSFLQVAIPMVIASALISIFVNIIKIKERHWTPFVCGMSVAESLIGAGLVLYLFYRNDILSTEFIAFIQGQTWGEFDIMRFIGQSGINPLVVGLSILVGALTIFECVEAIYKTIKYRH